MGINYFYAENVQRIRVVEVKNPGEVVVLEGENEQGKSSALNAMSIALMGKKNFPEKLIRDGEKKAFIKLDVGEYIVERTITEKTDRLSLTRKNTGDIVPSAQTKLNEIIGSLSFDPAAFMNLPKDKQAPVLKELIGLNFEEEDRKYKMAYDNRTDSNKRIKELDAQIKEYADVGEPMTARAVTLIQADIDEIAKHNQGIENAKKDIETLEEKIAGVIKSSEDTKLGLETKKANAEKEIKRIEDEAKAAIARVKENLAAEVKACDALQETTKNTIAEAEKMVEDLKPLAAHEPKTADKLKEELGLAVKAATYQARYMAKAKLAEKHKLEMDANDTYENELNQAIAAKKLKMESAKFPIPGLEIRDEMVYYNNIAFPDISGSLKIKVSMAVAMAQNPDLKVIFIRDANLLGKKAMDAILEIAKGKYQLWIERVESAPTGHKDTVFIEDGGVIAPGQDKLFEDGEK